MEILKKLLHRIIIPKAVCIEVVEKGKYRPGAVEVKKAIDKWIDVKEVKNLNKVEALKAVLDYK